MPKRRKLAAVLFCDIAGFTRQVSSDEVRGLEQRGRVMELVASAAAAHDGRVVKTIGDGAMLEFVSAVEAVRCALAMQKSMESLNAELECKEPLRIRVGVHVGDVVEEDDDLHGNAVNVARRVQEVALPGGICITREVYVQIRPASRLRCTAVRRPFVKDPQQRVEVLNVHTDQEASNHDSKRALRSLALLLIAVMLLAAGGVLSGRFSLVGRTNSDQHGSATRSRPLVIMMDSPHPKSVYDAATLAASGTNADVISDILSDLPVQRQKEAIGPQWHRDEEIRQFRPDLIIVHYSGFIGSQSADPYVRLRIFIKFFADTHTKFLIYSRLHQEQLGATLTRLLDSVYQQHPKLRERIRVFGVLDHGPPSWRNELTSSQLKLVVREMLNLP